MQEAAPTQLGEPPLPPEGWRVPDWLRAIIVTVLVCGTAFGVTATVFVDSAYACTSQDAYGDSRADAAISQVTAQDPLVAREVRDINDDLASRGLYHSGIRITADIDAILMHGYLWDCSSGTFYLPQVTTTTMTPADTLSTLPPPPPSTAPQPPALPRTTNPVQPTMAPPLPTPPIEVPPPTTAPTLSPTPPTATQTPDTTRDPEAAAAGPERANGVPVSAAHSGGIPPWTFVLATAIGVAAMATAYLRRKRSDRRTAGAGTVDAVGG